MPTTAGQPSRPSGRSGPGRQARSPSSAGAGAAAFLRAAAAAGTTRLAGELAVIVGLEAAHGREPLVAALERALAYRRFRAVDVEPILAAGAGVPRHREPGAQARRRPAGRPGPAARGVCPRGRRMTAATTSSPAPDLEAALRRLKLAAIRRLAPEVLVTARVQRWAPDELLRTLLEAELGSRDASNARARLRAAGFPVAQDARRVPGRRVVDPAGHVRLPRVARVDPGEGEPGPRGTRGHREVAHPDRAAGTPRWSTGFRVRYFAAASLAEACTAGLADNSVGRLIEGLLRADLVIVDDLGFAPLDDTGAQLLFRFVAAAYERRSLGVASHWPFESWGRFLPEHTTAVALLDRLLHHAVTVVTSRRLLPDEGSQDESGWAVDEGLRHRRGRGLLMATSGDFRRAIDTRSGSEGGADACGFVR